MEDLELNIEDLEPLCSRVVRVLSGPAPTVGTWVSRTCLGPHKGLIRPSLEADSPTQAY